MSKRILSLLLVVCMIFSIMPTAARAESTATSGSCGENAEWSFDEATGTLTIWGSGAMDDYAYYSNHAPWNDYVEKITSVDIKAGVTSIGDFAFSDCANLVSVTIPGSVTTIGSFAFSDCDSLTSITIPEGVTNIGEHTFRWCANLAEIKLPDSLTTIGDYVFRGCDSLTSITIPKNVSSIGSYVVESCDSLEHIWVAEDNAYYSSDDSGVLYKLYNKNKTTLVQAPRLLSGSYVVPDGVKVIGAEAFYFCIGLTDVTLPDSVTSIDFRAFCYCEGLTSVIIPDGVTILGNYAFAYCKALASITLPERLTTIGNYAFSNCTHLDNVTIPGSVTTIGTNAFYKCSWLDTIVFEGDAPSIGEDAFDYVGVTAYYPAYNDTWTRYVMQNYGGSVHWESYGYYGTCGEDLSWSLDEATGVLTISGTGAMEDYTSTDVSPWYFYREKVTSVVLASGVTYIGNYAFHNCSNLTEINIPDSVTTIGNSVFYGCSSLTAITIPDNATDLGHSIFSNCSSLTNVNIPEGVTDIGQYAFYHCSSLTSLTIPDSVTVIGTQAFDGCTNLVSINIPDGVTAIYSNAFWGCSSLTSINIPDSVTILGAFAFERCTSLTSIAVGDGVTVLNFGTFGGCTALTSATIGSGVTTIDDYIFRDCNNLTSITFEGDAPDVVFGGAFYDITTTAYYPAGNETWTEEAMEKFGSKITWVPYIVPDPGQIVEENGLLYYYVDGEIQYGAGLIYLDGAYYYIRSGGYAAVGEYWVTLTNDRLPQRKYNFGTDGKLIFGKHGIIEENGGLYYYFADVLQTGAGLIVWEDDYYYVRSSGQVATGNYWATKTNDLLPERMYNFGTDGKLVWGRHGIIEENGGYYYYFADVLQPGAGLILWKGDYYYIRSSGQVATGSYWATKTNDLLPERMYNFGENGKLIFGKHGIIEEYDSYYYYFADVLQPGAGLILWNDNYYYIRSSGQAATGKYWVTKTNGLLEEGYYTFNWDGKMIP